MKILGFMACHYVGDFFKESLLSVRDQVDKFHIAYSQNPSHGFPSSIANPDREFEIRRTAEDILGKKLIWETYPGFTNEIEHRNIRYKHSIGYSLILTLDPDEIWFPLPLSNALHLAYNQEQRFVSLGGYFHLWKGLEWCFQDEDRPIRIENLTRDNIEISSNINVHLLHMSMVESEDILKYKFQVFGHKPEIKPNYLEEKYFPWTPEKIDEITRLHPTRNDIWIKPVKYTGDLPESLKNHVKEEKRKMRILLIPMDYHRHKEDKTLFGDMLQAFQVENEAMIYDGEILNAIAFKPDVIHFQASASISELQVIKESTDALIIMWTGDPHYMPTEGLMDYRKIVDGYFLPFSGKTLDIYKALLEKPCFFIWEPIQNWRFVPNQQMNTGLITFVGNCYDLPAKREQTLDFIKNKIGPGLDLYGSGFKESHPNKDLPTLYNKSFAVVCENNYRDLDDYFTPRNLGAMAAGTCALMRWFPGIENHFQNLTHAIYYHNEYELLEWITYLYDHPDFRDHIADHGFKLANEKFTMLHWAQQYKNLITTHFLKS